mmetsp:Transcript_108692/g.188033  ORF Transcript_108692/g.188033 Transcript_108692/m.188033 type:complete len:96 (+) Transcript_108692:216-503(+)
MTSNVDVVQMVMHVWYWADPNLIWRFAGEHPSVAQDSKSSQCASTYGHGLENAWTLPLLKSAPQILFQTNGIMGGITPSIRSWVIYPYKRRIHES